MFFLYPQGSWDYSGLAVLWGYRHVVLGLCNSRALPGMASVSRSLRVRSGNTWWLRGPSNCRLTFEHNSVLGTHESLHVQCCYCVYVRVCLGGWDASPWNPPDSCWWFLRSLPVYLNRCHRATCPISAAPVLQSKTLSRSSLSITQMRLCGKTLSNLYPVSEQACLIFLQPRNLAYLIYKSQISRRL